jgi:hypothetical protein
LASAKDNGCRLATIVNGGRAILLKTQRSIKKIFLLYFKSYYSIFSVTALANPLDGSPARWIGQIHQIHAAGRAYGSATMVGVFIALFVGCGGWSRDVTSSSYVKSTRK